MNKTLITFLVAGSLVAVTGQTVSTNMSDGRTPPSIAPGAPDGVKAISDMERVNLYNGNLSLSVPLLSVGGRGEAGYTMQAPVGNAPWTITMDAWCAQGGGESHCQSYGHALLATNKELFPFLAPYSPGLVYAKQVGLAPMLCGSPQMVRYFQSDTHVVFERPDGTQVVLTDGGQPSNPGCMGGGNMRGWRFAAMDDSQIVFIANTDSFRQLGNWRLGGAGGSGQASRVGKTALSQRRGI